MEFPAKLRKLMRDQRYSQDMLARQLEVSQNLVSRWARGASVPDLRAARALAGILGVTLDYLSDDGQAEPPSPGMTAGERRVWEVVREIGADEAFRRQVTPPPLPPGTVLTPVVITPGDGRRMGAG